MIPFPPVVEPPGPDAFLTVSPKNETIPHGFSLPLMIGVNSDDGAMKSIPILNIPHVLDEFKANFSKVLPIILYYNHHSRDTQDKITGHIKDFYFKNGHDYNKKNYKNLTDVRSTKIIRTQYIFSFYSLFSL